jgi:uncharacterized repeat protein (TIGR03803 family)
MQTFLSSIPAGRRLRTVSALLGLIFVIPAVSPAATGPKLTTLYTFPGDGGGASPTAGVAIGPNANLFGTTYAGGSYGWGSVYQLVPGTQGHPWTPKMLYSFKGGADGAEPQSTIYVTKNNILFGTTTMGGSAGFGTVFHLTPPSVQGGPWTEGAIHSFLGGSDGANPQAGVIADTFGNLYGTTYQGGTANLGTIFQLVPPTTKGEPWTEYVLYSFQGGNDGANPETSLTMDSTTGILYGTTYAGGSSGWGTVFQLAPGASSWNESVLYTFTGATDGGGPLAGVTQGTGGVLYGSTSWGGAAGGCPLGGYAAGCGVIFQLTPPVPPATTWTQNVLYSFKGPPKDGSHPTQNLVLRASSGSLFGTTFAGASTVNTCFPASYTGCGMAFLLKPPSAPGGAWTKSPLAIFKGDNGGGPNGLVINSNGLLFGSTYVGGTSGGFGSVFELSQ